MDILLLSRPRRGRPQPRRRRLMVEDLEGRLVLNGGGVAHAAHHAVAPIVHHPAAHRAAPAAHHLNRGGTMAHMTAGDPPAASVAAQVHVAVPITVTGINLTGIQRLANGALQAVGTLTGTILGHPFTTGLTALITPAANPQSCPVLDLMLAPIHLNLLGLHVDTSAICLDVTAIPSSQPGGGLLGDLLCGGLSNVLGAAGTATDLNSLLPAVNGLLNDANGVLGGLNGVLGQLTGGFGAPTVTGTGTAGMAACNVLNLSLGPVNLDLLGLDVMLNNCATPPGPVTVSITAVPGNGNLLGNLLCSLANLLNNPGNPLGGVLAHLDNILAIARNAPPV